MKKNSPAIIGNLDIFVAQSEEEFDGERQTWHEILIHGVPEGLKSLAALLMKLADTDQYSNVDLPIGAQEHTHLRPGRELSSSSERVIVGRLDAKRTGAFYERYIPSNK